MYFCILYVYGTVFETASKLCWTRCSVVKSNGVPPTPSRQFSQQRSSWADSSGLFCSTPSAFVSGVLRYLPSRAAGNFSDIERTPAWLTSPPYPLQFNNFDLSVGVNNKPKEYRERSSRNQVSSYCVEVFPGFRGQRRITFRVLGQVSIPTDKLNRTCKASSSLVFYWSGLCGTA